MPERSRKRGLIRLLPLEAARDLFEPALQDLLVDHLQQRQRSTSSAMRGVLHALYVARVLIVFLDCWRLILIDSIRRDRRVNTHRKPQPKERFVVFLYNFRHALKLL